MSKITAVNFGTKAVSPNARSAPINNFSYQSMDDKKGDVYEGPRSVPPPIRPSPMQRAKAAFVKTIHQFTLKPAETTFKIGTKISKGLFGIADRVPLPEKVSRWVDALHLRNNRAPVTFVFEVALLIQIAVLLLPAAIINLPFLCCSRAAYRKAMLVSLAIALVTTGPYFAAAAACNGGMLLASAVSAAVSGILGALVGIVPSLISACHAYHDESLPTDPEAPDPQARLLNGWV